MSVLLLWCWRIHLATTWSLVGLIWMVQIVTYPCFLRVGPSDFFRFHQRHTDGISFVVGPLMILEILSAAALLFVDSTWRTHVPFLSACALLLLNWVSTFMLQVPLHLRLEQDHDPATIRRLIQTNWVRTASWTLRGILLLFLLPNGVGEANL